MAFEDVVKRAASESPHGARETVPGRVLLIDGDGLAYACAGADETPLDEAKARVMHKVSTAKAACGAEAVRILLTMAGSRKGERFAIARRKPYQGNRTQATRPKNWQGLRDFLEQCDGDRRYPYLSVWVTADQEADDLFAQYAGAIPDCVILTADKDMRMIPATHLDWHTHKEFKFTPGVWGVRHDDKLYGRAWFWSQMLHGDAADNIPGLPFYKDGSVYKSGPKAGEERKIPIGPRAAILKRLGDFSNDKEACEFVSGLYQTCYGALWEIDMLEQAILLWLRRSKDVFDVALPGGPLAGEFVRRMVGAFAAIRVRLNGTS